ncbi:hypothetical protein [Ruegeria sp. Alg231-54]|uniref:hypothetical protein n=1 Tax=Ruegeria sp. Alg231-54 TaxID=1922221 RepID=UPI000D562301|nr:hypothetical protein [Ruegeria sp. Alg231-54]
MSTEPTKPASGGQHNLAAQRQTANGWQVITDFLTSIYGPDKENQVWLAGFPDIETRASWFGMQGVDALQRRLPDVDNADLYFCTGLLREGANNRTLGEVVSQPLLYADDIGTKVDPAMWDAMFAMGFPEPTFRIETSPNNETWGWVLTGDAASPERWQELALVRAYMIERGLTDALHDATRYLRLPWGHNSKPKYKGSKNRAPAVGYTEWHPERSASIDQIGRVLIGGENWRDAAVPLSAQTSKDLAATGAGARPRTASMDDAIVRMAEIVDLEPRSRTEGVVDAMCPNWQAHGDRAETGFSFIGSDGACFCNHASCDNMRTPDFLAMIRTQYENHVSALNASGKNTESLPPSASAFLAGIAFESAQPYPADVDAMAAKRQETNGAAHERAAASVLADGAYLFQDRKGTVWLSRNGNLYDVSGKDRGILRLAAKKGHNLTGTAAGNLFEHLLNRVDVDAPREDVFFRQAQTSDGAGNAVLYVNCMEAGRAVKIDASGWKLVPLSAVPLQMTTRKGALPLPEPETGVPSAQLFPLLARHLPLASFNPGAGASDPGVQQRSVLLCILASALYRPGTVPHLMIAGQQGSGKTTMARRLTDLTDPDAAAVTSTLPREPEKMFPIVASRLNMVVDNASGITKATSDVLCAIASGTAHAARKLYSDGDRSILQAHASVTFTSVLSDIVRLPDIGQRTLRIEPPSISRANRRSESALGAAWVADYPKILGALYAAMAGGLKQWAAVQTDCDQGRLEPPRLSDAAITAEAIGRGLGWPLGLCMAALCEGEQSEAGRILEGNPVAWRIRALLQSSPGGVWQGTYSELETAIANVPAFGAPQWDVNRMPFKGQYDRLWPGLADAWGIDRELARTKNNRQIRLIMKTSTTHGMTTALAA